MTVPTPPADECARLLENIHRLCAAAGRSPDDLEAALGYGRGFLSELAAGRARLRCEMLLEMSLELRCAPAEIAAGTGFLALLKTRPRTTGSHVISALLARRDALRMEVAELEARLRGEEEDWDDWDDDDDEAGDDDAGDDDGAVDPSWSAWDVTPPPPAVTPWEPPNTSNARLAELGLAEVRALESRLEEALALVDEWREKALASEQLCVFLQQSLDALRTEYVRMVSAADQPSGWEPPAPTDPEGIYGFAAGLVLGTDN